MDTLKAIDPKRGAHEAEKGGMQTFLLVAMVGLTLITATADAQNYAACVGTESPASVECQNTARYMCAAAMSRDAHIAATHHIATAIQSYQEVGAKHALPAPDDTFLHIQTIATLAAYGPHYTAFDPLALRVAVEAQCASVGAETFWKQLQQETITK